MFKSGTFLNDFHCGSWSFFLTRCATRQLRGTPSQQANPWGDNRTHGCDLACVLRSRSPCFFVRDYDVIVEVIIEVIVEVIIEVIVRYAQYESLLVSYRRSSRDLAVGSSERLRITESQSLY